MYFWKIEELKNTLRNSQLPEKSKFIYLFLTNFFFILIINLLSLFPSKQDEVDLYLMVTGIINFIVGSCLIYMANGGNNGKYFLSKYISIGFVLGIRMFVFLLCVIFPIYLIINAIISSHSQIYFLKNELYFACFFIFDIIYYRRFYIHIKELNI